ncbi:MAG: hypothetical protein LBR20_06715 [Propionibacteriaceae bacterium]|jgi:hypothetical protein|nr:hypothetical protein [Propionibacteriaceae bacterium]
MDGRDVETLIELESDLSELLVAYAHGDDMSVYRTATALAELFRALALHQLQEPLPFSPNKALDEALDDIRSDCLSLVRPHVPQWKHGALALGNCCGQAALQSAEPSRRARKPTIRQS